MKIQRKILIIMLSLLIVVGIACTLISRSISTNIIKQQITDNLSNTTQSRAEHIKTFLDLEIEAVKQGSESVIIEELLLAEKEEEDYLLKYNKVIRRLKYTTQIGEYTYDIFVLDTKGITIASSDEGDIGKDKSNDPYFLEGKEGIFIKDAYISSHKQEKTLAFSAPILDEDNKLLGVIVFRVSPEPLFKITTNRTGLGQTGEAYLVNKNGYMITPSRFIDEVFLRQKIDIKHIHTEEANPTEPFDTLPEEEIAIIKDYRGIEVLSVHTHLPEMGWCLVAQIDTKEAFAPVTQLTNTLLLIFVIILFIAMFISSVISKTITRPLIRLHEGTEELTKGNLDFKVGTPSSDEVGQLSRAFDEMTTNLKKSRKELEDYSRNLEEKVEVRTRELSDINQNLEKEIIIRKKAEKQLERYAEELKESYEEMKQFTYIVSHDLRAPLVNLKGFSAELQYSFKEIEPLIEKIILELDEEQKEKFTATLKEDIPESIKFIDSSATRMDHFINALLKLSRLGRRQLKFEPIDMNALLKTTLKTLTHQIEKAKAKVEVKDLPEVIADKTAIEQVLGNILNNAIIYLEPNRPGEIEISAETTEKEVIFAIRDNGRGISEEDMSKVFVPFRRAGKQDVQGEGMGLAYVQTLVKLHNGRIWCESELRVGTKFFFTLSKNIEKGGKNG